jgi:hypothetical protein
MPLKWSSKTKMHVPSIEGNSAGHRDEITDAISLPQVKGSCTQGN